MSIFLFYCILFEFLLNPPQSQVVNEEIEEEEKENTTNIYSINDSTTIATNIDDSTLNTTSVDIDASKQSKADEELSNLTPQQRSYYQTSMSTFEELDKQTLLIPENNWKLIDTSKSGCLA